MGWMLAVGSISRIIGPFWSVQCLVVEPALTFGISAFLFLINIVAQLVWRDNLKAHWSVRIHNALSQDKGQDIEEPKV